MTQVGSKRVWWLGAAGAALGGALWLRRRLGQIPIGLSFTQTVGTPQGCEIIVAVSRTDWIVGLSHGEPPQLKCAWLEDGAGRELPSEMAVPLLTPLELPEKDELGGRQWGWRLAPTIAPVPERVVLRATFTAKGTAPFEFELDLRDGLDFNTSTKTN